MVYTEFKLFVGGLSWETDAEKLKAAFQDYGEIPFHRICSDQETGNSRGFGFVSFLTEAEGMKACAEMDGFELDGRALSVRPAGEKPKPGGAYGNDRDWSGSGGGAKFSSQECYAWAKFQCSRGDACRFSYEGPGGAGDRPKKPCFSWAKGDCKFGDGCNYSHDGEPGTVDPNTSQRQAKKIFGQTPARPEDGHKVDLGVPSTVPAPAEGVQPAGEGEKKRKAETSDAGGDDGDDSKKKKKAKKEKKKSKKEKKSKKDKESGDGGKDSDVFVAKATKVLEKKYGRKPTEEEVAKKAKKLAKKAAAAVDE